MHKAQRAAGWSSMSDISRIEKGAQNFTNRQTCHIDRSLCAASEVLAWQPVVVDRHVDRRNRFALGEPPFQLVAKRPAQYCW